MDIIETIIDAIWVSRLNLSHRKCIIALIRALLTVLSVNLLRLAREAFPQTGTLSTVRRIQRLLALGIFKITAVGKVIVKSLPAQEKYILTMDRTTWELGKRVYNILAIGICFDGISIPIYFQTLPKRGATNFVEQISFMEHVLDIIPAENIECLVADREFGYPKFIKWLNLMEIPYCLRIRENTYIRDTSDGRCRKAKTILASLAEGNTVVLSHSFRMNKTLKVRIYAVRRHVNQSEESLLILATPVGSRFTDRIYRHRWQIETTFRAMKTIGFNMEETHLPLNGRFQNMLVLIIIAYACAFIDGLVRMRQNPIPLMKRNGRKRFSIFTWGLDMITVDILQHQQMINPPGPTKSSENCHVP